MICSGKPYLCDFTNNKCLVVNSTGIEKTEDEKIDIVMIAGIAAGVAVAIIIIIVVAVCCTKKMKSGKEVIIL